MAPGLVHRPASRLTSITGNRSIMDDDTQASSSPQVAPRLICQVNGDLAQTLILPLDRPVIVGRTTQGPTSTAVDLDLKEFRGAVCGVSRIHAMLSFSGGELLVQDLNSTNGTRINGLRLEPNVRETVRSGDELEFGRVHVVVRVVFGAQ